MNCDQFTCNAGIDKTIKICNYYNGKITASYKSVKEGKTFVLKRSLHGKIYFMHFRGTCQGKRS